MDIVGEFCEVSQEGYCQTILQSTSWILFAVFTIMGGYFHCILPCISCKILFAVFMVLHGYCLWMKKCILGAILSMGLTKYSKEDIVNRFMTQQTTRGKQTFANYLFYNQYG